MPGSRCDVECATDDGTLAHDLPVSIDAAHPLEAMLGTCTDGLIGIRNRALLQILSLRTPEKPDPLNDAAGCSGRFRIRHV